MVTRAQTTKMVENKMTKKKMLKKPNTPGEKKRSYKGFIAGHNAAQNKKIKKVSKSSRMKNR
jgi:hypothetical protein